MMGCGSSALACLLSAGELGCYIPASLSPLGEMLTLCTTHSAHPFLMAGPNKGRPQSSPCSTCHTFQMPAGTNEPGGVRTVGTCTMGLGWQHVPRPYPGAGLLLFPFPKVAVVYCHLPWCWLRVFSSCHSGVVDIFPITSVKV